MFVPLCVLCVCVCVLCVCVCVCSLFWNGDIHALAPGLGSLWRWCPREWAASSSWRSSCQWALAERAGCAHPPGTGHTACTAPFWPHATHICCAVWRGPPPWPRRPCARSDSPWPWPPCGPRPCGPWRTGTGPRPRGWAAGAGGAGGWACPCASAEASSSARAAKKTPGRMRAGWGKMVRERGRWSPPPAYHSRRRIRIENTHPQKRTSSSESANKSWLSEAALFVNFWSEDTACSTWLWSHPDSLTSGAVNLTMLFREFN